LEQTFRYLRDLSLERAESLEARRHLATASCEVRQVPDLEIRSFSVFRSTHVVSGEVALAGVDVFTAKLETITITKAIDIRRK
jgi:hypothetical protein